MAAPRVDTPPKCCQTAILDAFCERRGTPSAAAAPRQSATALPGSRARTWRRQRRHGRPLCAPLPLLADSACLVSPDRKEGWLPLIDTRLSFFASTLPCLLARVHAAARCVLLGSALSDGYIFSCPGRPAFENLHPAPSCPCLPHRLSPRLRSPPSSLLCRPAEHKSVGPSPGMVNNDISSLSKCFSATSTLPPSARRRAHTPRAPSTPCNISDINIALGRLTLYWRSLAPSPVARAPRAAHQCK